MADLQNYLAGMSPAAAAGSGGQRRNVDLASAVTSDSLSSVIANQEMVDALVEHLPEVEGDDNKKQQLKETLSSPQFQQALSMFSNALQSGQLGPVVSQFQLNAEAVAAANSGDLEQFVKALENAHKSDAGAATDKKATTPTADKPAESTTAAQEENGKSAEKKTEDDEMAG